MAREPLQYPTDEEEAAINAGIAVDPDNPELDDNFFARARRAADVIPARVLVDLRRRGPQKAATKEMVAIRLDRDLVDALRSSGAGWQGRVNDILRKAVGV